MTPSDQELVDAKIKAALAKTRVEQWSERLWLASAAMAAGAVVLATLSFCP